MANVKYYQSVRKCLQFLQNVETAQFSRFALYKAENLQQASDSNW